jgi:hypothetical protein
MAAFLAAAAEDKVKTVRKHKTPRFAGSCELPLDTSAHRNIYCCRKRNCQ